MAIERDNGLSALLAGEPERICSGFAFTEGPVWVPADDALLFTDIPNSRIHRWREGMDAAEVWRAPSGEANGLTLDRDGHVLACEHKGRRVSRSPYADPTGLTSVAASYEGRRFNSPNDIVVDSTGALWFTDPCYGLDDDWTGKQLPHQGLYRCAPDGSLTLLEERCPAPNGLAFAPDESVLYLGDSEELVVWRYPVEVDGTLGPRELFVDMRPAHGAGGAPDGMKVDRDGRLWCTGVGGTWVVAPDGTLLGILRLPEIAANCAFGGAELDTLYLTARTSVYRVATRVDGIGPRPA